jgi:hypothetical protein
MRMTRPRFGACAWLLLATSGCVDAPHQGPGAAIVDPGDLRPEARAILEALARGEPPAGGLRAAQSWNGPPATIRVWRRSLGGNDSCTGKVDVLPLEAYVKGVLPHEWIVSWEAESLRAGALAVRSYASSWVAQGGKYKCADLCDTTYSQVYKDSTNPKTDLAVDATASQVLVKSGTVLFAEYSAENGDPTKSGVADPVCAGKTLYGHGRGMCQWGSQRWALQQKDHKWIALHYSPGAALWYPSAPGADAGVPPAAEAGSPPTPKPDLGARRDAGAAPPQTRFDAGPEPSPAPPPDAEPEPPSATPSAEAEVSGGCALLSARPVRGLPPLAPLALLALLLARRRRR